MMEQQQLLDGINRKKRTAWESLYQYFYGALCSYAERIIKDGAVAEDIVQECLITVWNSEVTFNDMKALRVYFYRAVHNNSLKYLRDKQVDDSRLKMWQDVQEELTDDYFYQAVEEEVIRKINAVISELPPQQEKVLRLSLSGMTAQEVADQLGMTLNTVKTHKKRAYSYLKENLQGLNSLAYIMFWLMH